MGSISTSHRYTGASSPRLPGTLSSRPTSKKQRSGDAPVISWDRVPSHFPRCLYELTSSHPGQTPSSPSHGMLFPLTVHRPPAWGPASDHFSPCQHQDGDFTAGCFNPGHHSPTSPRRPFPRQLGWLLWLSWSLLALSLKLEKTQNQCKDTDLQYREWTSWSAMS